MLLQEVQHFCRRKTAFAVKKSSPANRDMLCSMKIVLSAIDNVMACVSGKSKNNLNYALHPDGPVAPGHRLSLCSTAPT